MSELQSEVNGVQFITIDVDQDRETTSKDNVSSVPTVVMVKDGQEVHRFLGVKSKQTILELINQFS
jgi:thioredoxin 1